MGRTFRVFVSSTFSDLKEERNALQQRVFPRLRELCLQHGCRFQAIDLRWGVSEQDATRDKNVVSACLNRVSGRYFSRTSSADEGGWSSASSWSAATDQHARHEGIHREDTPDDE
jgi:hypothetical protein